MRFKIKALRESAGITQEDLAQKSGVSRTIVSGLESGRITITTTSTLKKIASALNKQVSDIFFDLDV